MCLRSEWLGFIENESHFQVGPQYKFTFSLVNEINENDSEDCVLICVSNILWNVSDFLENTEEKIDVISCLNLRGFFNTVDNYEEHSKLLDKASTLIVEVLG